MATPFAVTRVQLLAPWNDWILLTDKRKTNRLKKFIFHKISTINREREKSTLTETITIRQK